MQRVKLFTIALIAGLFLMAAPQSKAVQVSFSVNIGAPPVCPYGYFSYAPYNCAPYGYYGPQWFVNGVFIGAGRWFHGPSNFHGYVNDRYDPRHGYRGSLPSHGTRGHYTPQRNFRGSSQYNGHGQAYHAPSHAAASHGHAESRGHADNKNDHGHNR